MQTFLEASGNPAQGDELAVIGPDTLDWFAVFSWRTYESLGLKPGAKPDARELAQAIQRGTDEANAERLRQGANTLDILGWRERPRFDERSSSVEWAVESRESDGRQVINYYFGFPARGGMVLVELVTNPDQAALHRNVLRQILGSLSVQPEHSLPVFAILGLMLALIAALILWRQRKFASRTKTSGL
jgi:uncharacterized membrane-anchored protein